MVSAGETDEEAENAQLQYAIARISGVVVKQKKYTELSPQTPMGIVAIHAMAHRIATTREYFARAQREPAVDAEADIEDVHQLRVWTRRTSAILDLFVPDLVRRRHHRQLTKWLRRLRKSAGEARELDVLMAELSDGGHVTLTSEQQHHALAELRRLRHDAQTSLHDSWCRAQQDDLDRFLQRLLQSIRWRGDENEPTLGEFASLRFPELLDQFARSADLASRSVDDLVQLHRFRVEVKQFRYTCEFLSGGMAPKVMSILSPVLETLQEKLGRVNDHATAVIRLERWGKNFEGWQGLADFHRQQADYQLRSFQAWWTDDVRQSLLSPLPSRLADEVE